MKLQLNIAYAEKDVAKENGARWDREIKKWYLEFDNTQELLNKLNIISQLLGKKIDDIAPNMPEELKIDNHKNYINQIFSLNGMIEGQFAELKPEGAKTITGWFKEGYIPISLDVIKTYKYPSKENMGYQYIIEQDVRPMTSDEQQAYEKIAEERRKAVAKKAAETRAAKKENKEGKENKETKKYKNKSDAFEDFINLKGLSQEFNQFYEERCQKSEKKTDSKLNVTFGKNAKKIKHLPNYEEMQDKKILCFDTETTGFSPDKGDELLQVAFVTLEDGEIQTKFNSFVKPHEKTSWVGAMMKNHISPRMVANAPYPEQLKEQVQSIIDQADVIVGYNVDFDIDFLEKCMGIDFSNKIVADPSDYFRKNKPDCKSFALESCVIHYCTEEDFEEYKSNAHKADTDAIATLKAFCSQAKIEGYDLQDISEKERW